MWVRKLKRKTTKNIAVQIVQNYRNRKAQSRLRIIRHMGSVRPDAVDALVKLELAKLQEARKPSLFPAESYVEDVVAARTQPQDTGPLVIEDARKLEELRRLCLGFYEAIGTL